MFDMGNRRAQDVWLYHCDTPVWTCYEYVLCGTFGFDELLPADHLLSSLGCVTKRPSETASSHPFF
jgi:hypothetical protein